MDLIKILSPFDCLGYTFFQLSDLKLNYPIFKKM